MAVHTFHKDERLKSRKDIGRIFQEGQSFLAYPLKIAWVERNQYTTPSTVPVQFTQTVPKRRFAKASQRNRIRRRIHEAYRLNKYQINEALHFEEAPRFALIVIYVGKEELPYNTIHQATQKWISIFLRKILRKKKDQASNQS